MTRDLSRLLRPRSIAVIGGGAWGRAVVSQTLRMGFSGAVWPVHPSAAEIGGLRAHTDLAALPGVPDAVFIGVNRHATVELVAELAAMGAGGAVCFASGFREAAAEDGSGGDLQQALCRAAGDMPVLGPNCYGFINGLDGALLWPDQHGVAPCARGVAIVTQSSNIAINLTMQSRALPLAYVVTAGNQAQTGIAAIGAGLLDDPRVTALGLHIEGFGDLGGFEALAEKARALGKPVVALKIGRSAQAQAAAVSHTASMTGGEAGARALLERLGIARVASLPELLETLKLLHVTGPLTSGDLGSISCSGGEASLVADTAHGRGVRFPPLTAAQRAELRAALGPMVALANPLDYHTYIWRDTEAMTRAWAAMMAPHLALTLIVLDYPRADRADPSDWECATAAALAAKARTGANVAVVATLPELLPEAVARRFMEGGVVPLNGLSEAIAAAEAAAFIGTAPLPEPPLLPPPPSAPSTRILGEAAAKAALAAHGLEVPRGATASGRDAAARAAVRLGGQVALKGAGPAHKTEAGAVALNLAGEKAVHRAAASMPVEEFLVEEMIGGAVAELLVGVVKDPAHGFVLTLAAGGTLTELMADSAALLVPASDAAILRALDGLRIARLLDGYRGAPAADRSAILAAIRAVQSYVVENADRVEEVEINPLICTPARAVAADALIWEAT
ncbi:acyl-CoA synthetase [Maritimibacter sp. 55A14]|uniref:acetate--CoA ligase family protein n=1 Tax=Maritimibacter sp. 55A14 TaxID=2174844 RepID=UPI000D612FC8|nr:acetate--CoA ligase family protein [Maritimibacter sp. 55A14]PWE32660.1 acyl-CoA synthetase [Maritimibacter sp. 55A14]